MTETKVFQDVREILAVTLRVDPARVRHEARLEHDLGMDSLRMIETNVAIEARFGLVAPELVRPDELGIETVGDLVQHVCRTLGSAP
jgi:acyl carrier protein